jgi:hypothetical protein
MKHTRSVAFGSRSLPLAVIFFVSAAVSIARPDDDRKESFADSFDTAGEAMWQPFPSAAKVEGGVVTVTPPEGQQWLASASRFQYGELEMTVRFNRLSTDSTIFYYLGFQSLMPWARQVCWLQVQDAQMNVVVTKDGAGTINVPVVSGLKTGQWYRLKLQWTAAALIASVDGRVVFSSAEQRHRLSSAGRAVEIVPAAPMHVFLSVNTLDNKKGLASLSLDDVRFAGTRPMRADRPPVTNHTARLDRDLRAGSPDSAIAELRGGRIRLESAGLACQWDAAAGLAWRQLVNKPRGVPLLYESGNSPLFIVLGKDFYCDSRDCIIEDVRINGGDVRRSAELSLRHQQSGLTFRLGASLAAGEDLRLWLRVRNNGAEARRLQMVFPIVGRVRTDGTFRGLRYFYPWRSGIVGDVDAYLMNEYGNLAWMQVMCAFDPASGAAFSLFPRDSTGEVKGLVLKKQSPESGPTVRHCEVILQEEVPSAEPLDFDQGLGMACYALPRIVAPGGDIELPEASLSVYGGDWKPALRDYARWLHTWYRHVATPGWFRDCFGYVPCHPPFYYSYERNKYVCADKLRGNEHIFQWAFWDDYTHNPEAPACYLDPRVYRPGDFDVNRQRGGLPTFCEEIRRLREQGSRFTLYMDHRFCWSGTKTYDAHAKDWTAHYRPGAPGVYRTPDEACMCFLEPDAWAEHVAATCGRLVRDAGPDGIYLDELNIAFPCYNPAHRHYRDGVWPVSTPLLARHVTAARDAMRRENPEAILMTEHAGSDYMSQFVDGSWVQTYYRDGFPFAEKYFDAESLHYFRFVCPEFKLAEWGANSDGSRRCLFNGIGFIGHDYGGAADVLQTLRENGDAFATLQPEPHVATLVEGLLANRFPVDGKLVYTLYNKSGALVAGEAIEVESLPGGHWVECLSDVDVGAQPAGEGRQRLSLNLQTGSVACVSRLHRLLSVERIGATAVTVTVSRKAPAARLVAYLDTDTGLPADGREVKVSNAMVVVDVDQLFGRRGKLILKLLAGSYLVDEAIIAL